MTDEQIMRAAIADVERTAQEALNRTWRNLELPGDPPQGKFTPAELMQIFTDVMEELEP